MRYIEALEIVDYQYGPAPKYIDKQFIYYAYTDGNCFTYDTKRDAKSVSSLVEKKCVNEIEHKKSIADQTEYFNKVFNIWYNALREEYNYFTDVQFNIIYSMAYDRGHSSGYDEVANYMIDYSDFASRILETVK